MLNLKSSTPRLGMAALLAAAMFASPALAGEQTRAEAAIAQASGKIDAGDKAGAGDQAPDLQRQARAALMNAQDLLAHHQKSEAIAAANQASDLADQAITTATRRRADAQAQRRQDQSAAVAGAQESTAIANARANSAQQSTAIANERANSAQMATTSADARAQTAEAMATLANQRAAAAEQASALATAQVNAMRDAAAAKPVVTTVALTEHDNAPAPVHHVRHHPVNHHAHAAPVKTTTTTATVTTSQR